MQWLKTLREEEAKVNYISNLLQPSHQWKTIREMSNAVSESEVEIRQENFF